MHRNLVPGWPVIAAAAGVLLAGCVDRAGRPRPSTPDEAAERGGADVTLRPSPGFLGAHEAGVALPFYQAVPMAPGAFFAPAGPTGLAVSGRSVPADVRVAAHWPDGSAQWVAISGAWPSDLPLDAAVRASLVAARPGAAEPAPFTVRPAENGIEILDAAGNRVAALRPQAAGLRMTEPKAPDSVRPEDLDASVQFRWAEERERLNPDGEPFDLHPRATEFLLEEETPASVLYRLRGDGGAGEPGEGLEWQLRVRVFRHAPVIRFQMTWFFHWDTEIFALASARWVASFDAALQSAEGADRTFALGEGPVSLAAAPPGHSRVTHGDPTVLEAEWPDPALHTWVVGSGSGPVGIGLPDFTRLGPNRLKLDESGIEVACWDGRSGLALDLRQTVARDEYGMAGADFETTAVGLARTVEMTWTVHPDAGHAGIMARAEAARDGLWFANRADLVASQALGPWREGAFERNRLYVEGLAAQVHWMIASRDHFRWNGFVNFGDIRTNWTRTGWAEGGLHPMIWGLHGRYGWRNGSGEPYRGFLTFGLWAEDRDVLLFAFDYARHVADVDVVHGRFGRPIEGDQGGMHRRNKNHWSGDVQMQYTPSRGLYLAKWLTGFERFDETLAEIRDYSKRFGGGSVFGASSWLNRYTETGDPADLAAAEELLQRQVSGWEGRNRESEEHGELRGLAALYAGNFRLSLDWWPILIEFHRATGDPRYMEAMAERVRDEPLRPMEEGYHSRHYPVAYLLAHGFAEEQLGTERMARLREALRQHRLRECPPREEWNYRVLTRNYRAVNESFGLGLRAGFAPLVLGWFDSGEAVE